MSELTKSQRELLADLAGGAVIEHDGDYHSYKLITYHAKPSHEDMDALEDAGFLLRYANGGGYRISDEGKRHYIRSTDELRQ